MAMDPTVDCSTGGAGLYEQSMCMDKDLSELRQQLEKTLSPTAVGDFDMSAMRICQGAWSPSKQVVIYPLAVRGCIQNLMEAVLEEVEEGSMRFP